MSKLKPVLYMHAGSGNHGCEAIVNSVCHMIKEKAVLVSYYGKEDETYSLNGLCEIVSERKFEKNRLAHVLYYLYRKLTGDGESFIRYRYGKIFKGQLPPLAISIGGDNYCYDNMLSDLRLTNLAFHKKGTKTMLLGCSIEPKLLENPAILEDLGRYHTIIARESITYRALQTAFADNTDIISSTDNAEGTGSTKRVDSAVHSPRILCYPDPAFTLEAKKLPLPEGFLEGNTVGLNVSPMIQENEKKTGITLENYRALLRFILEHTQMQVALIPHVVWERNDDRKTLHALYEEFKTTGRVLELADGNCQELKGYIGRCRFFVGARTHATIAAYSSLVPTLVVGYSVKARGIAEDLFGTWEHYVIPVQSLREPEDLVQGFRWLMEQEEEIKNRLRQKMPSYQEEARMTGKEVDQLWEELGQRQKI